MDMVEKVARAMREELDIDWPYRGHESLIDVARAAIAAMRDPSESMVEAGGSAKYSARRDGVDRRTPAIWQAMIDVALGEE